MTERTRLKIGERYFIPWWAIQCYGEKEWQIIKSEMMETHEVKFDEKANGYTFRPKCST